jgi:hypothetical protein
MVVGRVVYRGWDDEESWVWHEWLLGGSDGRMIWLAHDEKGFGLYQKMRFRAAFNAQSDWRLDIGNGKQALIHERYPAQILGAEGELTWRAKRGDKLFVAEGAAGGNRYSIQQTPDELEVYEGRLISEEALAGAFGNLEWQKTLASRKNRRGTALMIGAACILFAVIALFAAMYVSNTGEEFEPRFLSLSQTQPSQSFTVDFDQANRPAVVAIDLRSGGIPDNTFVDLDVSITSPDGTQNDLFSQELWHESGRDEDGPWRETHYRHSEMFVPFQTGEHTIQVDFDPTNPVSGVDIAVTVRRNHILPIWFVCYAAVTGVIGFLIAFYGGGRASAKS